MKSWGIDPDKWAVLSDRARDLIVEYEQQVCPLCGNLRSVCRDEDREWHPRTSVCWPTAVREWSLRLLAEKYKDVNRLAWKTHPMDGLTTWASEDAPPKGEDLFARPWTDRDGRPV